MQGRSGDRVIWVIWSVQGELVSAGRSSRWQGGLIDGRVLAVFTGTFQVCNFSLHGRYGVTCANSGRLRSLSFHILTGGRQTPRRTHCCGESFRLRPLNQGMDAHLEGVARTFAEQVAKDALHRRKETHGAIKCAADFHCEIEDLVDLVEVLDDIERKSQRQFCFEEREGCKHRMIKVTVGKHIYQCVRCNKRSNCGEVPGTCYGLQWVHAKCNSEADAKSWWRGCFIGGHLLQTVVDGDKVRALLRCRRCAGWTTPWAWQASENHCQPTDPSVARQVRKLQQGINLDAMSAGLMLLEEGCQ